MAHTKVGFGISSFQSIAFRASVLTGELLPQLLHPRCCPLQIFGVLANGVDPTEAFHLLFSLSSSREVDGRPRRAVPRAPQPPHSKERHLRVCYHIFGLMSCRLRGSHELSKRGGGAKATKIRPDPSVISSPGSLAQSFTLRALPSRHAKWGTHVRHNCLLL